MKKLSRILSFVLAVLFLCIFSGTAFAVQSIVAGSYGGYGYTLEAEGSITQISATLTYGTTANILIMYKPSFFYYNTQGKPAVMQVEGTISYGNPRDSITKSYSVAQAADALGEDGDKIPAGSFFQRCFYQAQINRVDLKSLTQTYRSIP